MSKEDVISIALENNPQIEIARQQAAGSDARLTQARSLYWPHLTAGGNYGRTYIQDLVPTDEDNVGNLLFSVSQLIYDFGRTTGLIDVNVFNVQAADENLRQVYHDAVLKVKESYYTVLEKKELIHVARQAVENYEKQLYRAKRYREAGVRTRIDVTNAEVNLSNQRLNLLQAKADLKAARVELEQVMGTRPYDGSYDVGSAEPALESLVERKPDMPESLDELLESAEEHRPGLSRYGFLVQAAESSITRAEGDYWPVISATGTYNSYDTDLSSLADQWQVGAGLSWEFFSGFETEGRVAEAKAGLREVNATLREFSLSVTQQVTDSYLRADENREGVDIAGQTLGLAAENLELADKRYQSGLGDLLEFNDAQLLYTQNQTSLVITYYSYLKALSRIEWATGIIPELEGYDYR